MSQKTKSLKVILTSGRTIEQGISLVGTKTTNKAKVATGVCYMDPSDLDKLAINDGDNVEITTSEGSIIVKAYISKDRPHKGIVFMPLGIYANWITPPDNAGIGVPQYKGIDAIVKPSDKEVVNIDDLIAELENEK